MTTNHRHVEHLIIGGGGMGLAAAYRLAKAGRKPLVLEQFPLYHTRGSSHTEHRIIRRTYNDPIYAKMMVDAYRLWGELEADAGQKLMYLNGGVEIGPADDPTLNDIIRISQEQKLPIEVYDAGNARKRFPQFRLRPDWLMAFAPLNGFVAVDDCVRAHGTLAQKYGATIQDNEPVLEITPLPRGVQVRTTTGIYTCDKLIISAGAYVKKLLQQTGLDVPYFIELNQAQWFSVARPEQYVPERFPVFIVRADQETIGGMYGFPTFRRPGIKVAVHHSNIFINPDEYDQKPRRETIERVAAFVREFLPDANPEPIDAGACLYDFPPDEHFVLSLHPQYPDIVMANMAGHGYKFASVVGEILAQFATRGETDFDLTGLSVARFFDPTVERRAAIHVDISRVQAKPE